jgi:hypothetical protein
MCSFNILSAGLQAFSLFKFLIHLKISTSEIGASKYWLKWSKKSCSNKQHWFNSDLCSKEKEIYSYVTNNVLTHGKNIFRPKHHIIKPNVSIK